MTALVPIDSQKSTQAGARPEDKRKAMTKYEIEERTRFTDIIERESKIKAARSIAGLILENGKTYAHLREAGRSGLVNYYRESIERFNKRQETFRKRIEKSEGRIENRVEQLCKQLGDGFSPVFADDPWSNTIKIKVPSGYTNDLAQEGVSVPTS